MTEMAARREAEAVDLLMRLLAVEGVTGREGAIAQQVAECLQAFGMSKDNIRFDRAHKKIPLPTESGNLIVRLPGTLSGPRLLFMAHMDTVPLCAGAVPVRKGKRILPAGATALGGDDRTGVACLVYMLSTLLRNRLPHPPLTVLFTVREESGLWGARFCDVNALGRPAMAFNVDGRSPRELTIGAVGAERWEAEILGRAAHAGVHPERGISATMVASLALAQAQRAGWFGRINQDGCEGTANVGSFGGRDQQSAGEATNVVTDYARVRGEARSHQARSVRRIVAVYRRAFRDAAQSVHDDRGRKAKVQFRSRLDYYPFRLREDSGVIRHAREACRRAGWEPDLRVTDGGLDANWMVRHGIPTITFGAGQHEIHTREEYVDIGEYLEGCRLALALASPVSEPRSDRVR